MDFFLKFDSEEEAIKTLYTVIPAEKNEAGEVTKQQELRPKFVNIDTIGVVSKPTGKFTEQKLEDGTTIQVPVMETLPGWHVNVRAILNEDTSELGRFAVQPKSPIRVWA